MMRSSRLKSGKPIARKTAMKKRNPQKAPGRFARQFGSKARVLFVKSLPCAACGVVGYSENAHLLGNDGMSRRGPYTSIGPLCGPHYGMSQIGIEVMLNGCHASFDETRMRFNQLYPQFDAERVAAETDATCEAAGVNP